jgi:uncharacterized iron-regulated membrane protein
LPDDPGSILTARSKVPQGLLTVAVDPYRAQVVAVRYRDQTAASVIHRLHTELLAGAFGRCAVGLLGALFAAVLLSGLGLWWSTRRHRKSSFPLGREQWIKPTVADCHRLLGAGSFAVLLTIALTGVCFVYPGAVDSWRVSRLSGDEAHGPYENLRSTAVQASGAIGLTAAFTMMRGLFPGAKVTRIATPADASGTYRVELCRAGESCSHHASIVVWADQYSGQALAVDHHQDENLHGWLRLWHTGEAMGFPGRMLWFMAGLVPSVLYGTGVVAWLRKRRADLAN